MQKLNILAATVLASGLLGTSVGAMAQSNSQSGGQSSSSQSALPSAPTPVAPTKDKSKPGTTPAANPDPSAAAAPDSPQSDTPKSSPDAPQAPAKKPSTTDDNAFPEEISAAAAKAAAAATPSATSTTNQTPSEKQAQGSSSRDNTDQLGLDDPARKQLKLGSPDGTTDVYDPKRATEDVRVGKFYLQTGYFKGAYERFKDATTFDHENVEAVFYLAEAAQRLNLAKEAEQNYQLYLAAMPDGPSAKAAKKALGELGTSSKP